mmetsp:Transcript_10700/g.35430  ORF Transcript_10700/g.35430 Transcript_10700/m.35430 type:complete len:445 (-) Transcript_10700:32-1366(-)|eukprot:CAMPEP_0118919774 /NCGR_PEP_ID=MMETSP1166-20130328/18733_1 /TAXON_ID=1104430 /ORGANISM="Chrysoreinhardia sp, Strain CCMP3193" /LENGTH=444 /DNA_ID=CAMNT_0006860309 /DNA_START=156 /DNA_END=1490 /DNA_ORIENTATION=+
MRRGGYEALGAQQRVASVASSVVNLSKTIVGSGVLGFPFAFAQLGVGLGSSLLLVCAVLSAFGLHLLAASAALTAGGEKSFRSVSVEAAPWSAELVDVAVSLKCFGVATSYLIVIGDTTSEAFSGDRWPWLVGSVVLVAPLCLSDTLDALKFTSAASMVLVLFLTAMMLVGFHGTAAQEDDDVLLGGNVNVNVNNVAAAKSACVFIFGFTCQQNIFAIVNELDRPTQGRIGAVILSSIAASFVIYLAVAATGFATFGRNVEGDVLDSYGTSDGLAAVRVAVALIVAFSYPLQLHPSRACFLSFLDGVIATARRVKGAAAASASASASARGNKTPAAEGRRPAEPVSLATNRTARVATTLAILGGSLAIALTVENLTTVLAVVGATGSTVVSYIVPGGAYYALAPPSLKRHCALLLFLFGLVVMPTALALIFFSKENSLLNSRSK